VVLPKKNCDASFQKNLKSAGWGFVFSDDNGDVIQAARGKLNHVLDVFQAELIACLQGLQRAADLGITKIILATDAIQVQQATEAYLLVAYVVR
jgi:ribonuclease HI